MRHRVTRLPLSDTARHFASVTLSDGCNIEYTRYNAGKDDGSKLTPLLLISGWTCTREEWGGIMTNGLHKEPRFSGGREVIAYDNRGVGESSVTPGPYSVESLAADAAELLDRLGISRAHVLGLSMGGMVAQQMAVEVPSKVASLVLCSTTAGGRKMTAADKSFARSFFGSFRKWSSEDGGDEASRLECARAFVRGCLPPCNGNSNTSGLVERMARAYLLAGTRTVEGINAQLGALGTFGGTDLSAIHQPTLVVHGSHDQVLPFPNAVTLATEIPGARLLRLEGHGHLWPYTHESAVRTIDKFLLDVEAEDLAESYTAEPYVLNYC